MYDYIAEKYGIRPVYGERVRLRNGLRATVKRERPSHGHYVAIHVDGHSARHVSFAHPRDIEYLDRGGAAMSNDDTDRLHRIEDALITVASVLDIELARRSPHYPPTLSSPELGLLPGDLDGLWFGSWEATYEARKHDPRYTRKGGDES